MHKKAVSISLGCVLLLLLLSFLFNKLPIGEMDKVVPVLDLISWIVSGILAMVGLLAIFLTLNLEHKVQRAIESLLEYFNPYDLTSGQMKNLLTRYAYYIKPDYIVSSVYHIYITTTIGAIISWGITLSAVLVQTKPSLSFNLSNIVNITSIFAYTIFIYILVYFADILRKVKDLEYIRHSFFKGNIVPSESDLVDLDFLYKNNARVTDVIERSQPFFNAYSIKKDSLIVLKMPIGFKKLNFNFTIQDTSNNKIFLQVIGRFSSDENPGDSESLQIYQNENSFLFEYLLEHKGNIKLFLEVYDETGKKIFGKYVFSVHDWESYRITFTLERVIRIVEPWPFMEEYLTRLGENEIVYLLKEENTTHQICRIDNSEATPGKVIDC